MAPFGKVSNMNGQFWYGSQINFPGFLYKKNVGVGVRRSTRFVPGGTITCNASSYSYNKFRPGSGVGASSIAVRRAKNIHATICSGVNSQCGAFFNALGNRNM